MPHHSKICQEAHSKKARLIRKQRVVLVQNELKEVSRLRQQLTNEENLRFLINKRSIKLLQEAKELKISKEKLKEHTGRLQRTVEKLKKRNYYLGQEGLVLRGRVRDYQGQNRVLKGFALMIFMLGQLIVGLYLLGLFDSNNACVIIF